MSGFFTDGYEILKGFVTPAQQALIADGLNSLALPRNRGGIRHLDKKLPVIDQLVRAEIMLCKAAGYIGGSPQVVRVMLLDKTADNNWLVTWHQDKTIAVSARVDIAGWAPWSIKDGVHHVQPSLDVLNSMVTFRIHIDPATTKNGCLNIIPRSHQHGILTQDELSRYAAEHASIACIADAGSVLVMRPHLLHSSRKASHPQQRRVIHVEYCSYLLPEGLNWA